jgi:hypothetical protein
VCHRLCGRCDVHRCEKEVYVHCNIFRSKVKVHPRTGHEVPEGKKRYSSTLSLTSALDGGGWSVPRPGRFTHGNDPVPIVQETGWAPGLVWTGAENLAPTGIRFLDCPTRSELLYQLRYYI